MTQDDYLQLNKSSWNKRTDVHIASDFYDNASFKAGKSSLNDIELDLLGDVNGKSILHLQCHFGQDTISFSRMGAKAMGIDLSDRAIEEAKKLNQELGTDAEFICTDLYSLPDHLDRKFDIVFTSYGTIGWLPDMSKWAKIVSRYLKPGGTFLIAEFHPVVWMFDDYFKHIKYSYFNTGVIEEEEEGTYADQSANIKTKFMTWNHPISDVVNNLIVEGLLIEVLNEYDYSPYDCFQQCEKLGERRFRIKHLESKIPMVYAIKAKKKK